MNGAATACGSHASTALCFDISPAWVGQGPGFNPLGRVTHSRHLPAFESKVDMSSFDPVPCRRRPISRIGRHVRISKLPEASPGKAMNCRHRPTSVSTAICGLVLGNWPHSVLGKQVCSPRRPGIVKGTQGDFRPTTPSAQEFRPNVRVARHSSPRIAAASDLSFPR
jgi:hypothetical protein